MSGENRVEKREEIEKKEGHKHDQIVALWVRGEKYINSYYEIIPFGQNSFKLIDREKSEHYLIIPTRAIDIIECLETPDAN